MNGSPQQKQPEKESYVLFGFLLCVIGLAILTALLKLIGTI
jgi:hypothetical protein